LPEDNFFNQLKEKLQKEPKENKYEGYQLRTDNILMYNKMIYVSNSTDFRHLIMVEFHRIPYGGHPGYQKMVTTIMQLYYWSGMKQDIDHYIAKCLECQHVKVEHRHPAGLLQPIHISKWKWEVISKTTHLIPINYSFNGIDVAIFFMKEIIRLHDFPKTIISYRDAKFTSNFLKNLFAGLETELAFNMTYHPQNDS